MFKSMVALVAVISALSACGGAASGDKYGVSLYKFDDTFINNTGISITNRAKEVEGATVVLADGQGAQPTQNDQIDTFITQNVKALGINMVDRTAASVIIEKAKNANIPIVFFNREPVESDMNSWDKVYYVGAKAEESGTMQGQALAKYWKENMSSADRNGDGVLQYVMLTGEPGHQDAILRTEYSVKAIMDEGIKVQKLAEDTGMWQRVNGQEKMAAWISAYGDRIEAVIANNDDMGLGAIEALKAAGYFTEGGKYVPVLSVDATAPALDALREGTLFATVLNDAKGQGYVTFDLMDALAKGTDPSTIPGITLDRGKYVWVPYVPVTRDNYEQFTQK
ncbi:MAG: galactose ABC transporter substrate-binding protein [Brevinema sp.]